MVKLTRLNNQPVVVNPDHIYAVDASPDTTLRLIGGETILVRQTIDELVDLIVAFKNRVVRDVTPTVSSVVAVLTERQAHDGGDQ